MGSTELIASYNCRGLPIDPDNLKFKPDIFNIFDNDLTSFILLQETFLIKQELDYLNSLYPGFHGIGTATVDGKKEIMQGHAPGGVAIFWKAKFDSIILPIVFPYDWIIGVELKFGAKKCIILNVYMPCESSEEHEEQFLENLGNITAILSELDCTCIYILGDWNSDMNGGVFIEHLKLFLSDNNLIFSSELLLPADSFTYLSEAWGTTSWLDHCVSTSDAHDCIQQLHIDYNGALSDHFPIYMSLATEHIPELSEKTNNYTPKFDWSRIEPEKISEYTFKTDEHLSKIDIKTDCLACQDANCSDQDHLKDLNKLYDSIVDCLQNSGNEIRSPNKPRNFKPRPGWKEHVADLHESARDFLAIWTEAGKPRFGYLFEMMTKSRLRFKYALRSIKRKEEKIKCDNLAKVFLHSSPQSFWKEIRKINCARSSLPSSIEGMSTEDEILELWRKHYSELFNCIQGSKSNNSKFGPLSFSGEMIVTSAEITEHIKKLKDNKACGQDGIHSEHLKFASARLSTLLALCFTSFLIHGVLPDNIMSVVLVPVIKDKAGKINSKDNYRPIALASILSKIFEMVILDRISIYLLTNDNQFGFKKKLGTDSCIYVMKQIIDQYNSLNGSVFMCFLDASKAFDRVNHNALFSKLQKRGVPLFIIRILSYWYSNQTMCVRWSNKTSSSFTVSNGVRQGSILSPYLFNIYMDDLSDDLNSTPIGCYIGKSLFNHLMYADDLVLMCPSATGLRLLLKVCHRFGISNDVKFNSSKSSIMICRSKSMLSIEFGDFLIGNDVIPYKPIVKYLGHYISDDMSDNRDIKRQYQYLYGRANMLVKKFKNCSDDIKVQLFRSYCTGMYTGQLWWNYSKCVIRKLIVAYNRAFRLLMGYPRDCSASGMFANNRLPSAQAILRNLCYKFIKRLEESENNLIHNIRNSDIWFHSNIRKHWLSILYM